MAKMNACRAATKISNPTRTTASGNETTARSHVFGPSSRKNSVPRKKIASRKCPARKLAAETDGQRDRPHDDVRDELDQHQQRVAEPPRAPPSMMQVCLR